MTKSVLLCTCLGSQTLDAKALSEATGLPCARPVEALCTRNLEQAAQALEAGEVVLACQQEHALFEELAEELGAPEPVFVDLRDRAGWSDEGAKAGPKQAALLAEALLPRAARKTLDVTSEGLCLIVGAGEGAVQAAEQLAAALSVTLCLTDATDPPETRDFDVVRGQIKSVSGALGGFDVRLDALQQMEPGGRGARRFGPPQDGGRSRCDLLIDLTGGPAFVPAPQKREGYLRADPRDPLAVARLLTEAVQMSGIFEKPLYLHLEPSLCAHTRAGQVGCSKCLNACPAGALTPDGDHVSVDPMVCAGCGMCTALCPSGAISFEDPSFEDLTRRIEVLSRAYRSAGGTAPRLLVHDADHGAEMIRLAARHGRGLPADVLPLELDRISGFGHAEQLAALACGFVAVDLLLAPTTEREALESETHLAAAIAGPGKLRLLDPAEPDALCDLLYGVAPAAPAPAPVLPMGSRRQVARLAAQALNPGIEAPLPLPDTAPYGAVLVDTDACTLCLSCVSLCPSGALLDNPDRPELRFQEDACLQCGICRTVCPEDAITLKPQLDLSDAALSQQVLNEEEPFACVECGKLFGVKSTIEKVTEKLAGQHAMFARPDALRMIQMCDDCRVNAQFKATDNPFAMGEPRRPRTTDDYLSDRKDH
ncbi:MULTISPECIES: 4Fe-4S binding protein [unclassified Meridianimarinicoccus]|uniref:4Fe-4S binding protein n=1 Tax=unclassified Meridianimarinicoccus TaxID=2923344 RepID=UPI0018670F13|nr:4Fe-4S binding protein [Fluviibacterium sp. MJW13]